MNIGLVRRLDEDTNGFLLLVVRPGATSSVLVPSSDARNPSSSFLLLVAFGC